MSCARSAIDESLPIANEVSSLMDNYLPMASEVSSLMDDESLPTEAGSLPKGAPWIPNGLAETQCRKSHSPVLDPSARVCVYMSECEPLHGSRGRAKRSSAYGLICCSLLPLLYYSHVQCIRMVHLRLVYPPHISNPSLASLYYSTPPNSVFLARYCVVPFNRGGGYCIFM